MKYIFLFTIVLLTNDIYSQFNHIKPFKKVYNCQTTIYSNLIWQPTYYLFEYCDTTKIIKNDKIYYSYVMSLDSNSTKDLIRIDSNKIYIWYKGAKKETLFFDYDVQEGDTWELNTFACSNRIFRNTIMRVDKVKKFYNDTLYYVSCSNIINISNTIYVDSFILSKELGFISIVLKDGHRYGDPIYCNLCKEKD